MGQLVQARAHLTHCAIGLQLSSVLLKPGRIIIRCSTCSCTSSRLDPAGTAISGKGTDRRAHASHVSALSHAAGQCGAHRLGHGKVKASVPNNPTVPAKTHRTIRSKGRWSRAPPPRDQPAATRTEAGYFLRTKATTSLHQAAQSRHGPQVHTFIRGRAHSSAGKGEPATTQLSEAMQVRTGKMVEKLGRMLVAARSLAPAIANLKQDNG